MKAQVGKTAPPFTLRSLTGEEISLSDFIGKKPVVVYFYPKDDTRICTAQACSFRDNYEDFKKAGAEVIGISSDSSDSHQQFASKYKLPFILLSDEDGKIRKLYGVPTTLGLIPGRVTYIIDKAGIVRHIFSSQFDAQKHILEALKVLGDIA